MVSHHFFSLQTSQELGVCDPSSEDKVYGMCHLPHLTDKETDNQRGEVTYPRSHSRVNIQRQMVLEWGPGFFLTSWLPHL